MDNIIWLSNSLKITRYGLLVIELFAGSYGHNTDISCLVEEYA
jgi:hypothetical protein